jgi:NAD(P)-dependent dehydrogenase (short-subunit alcohol dehydrogenase family)
MSVLDRFHLTDKVAIVTGAGKGIGAEIALAYADAGADVALLARTVADLEQIATGVEERGRRALIVPTNVMDLEALPPAVEQIVAELGGVDILVNNAGIGIAKPLVDYTEEDWDRQLGVNLKGMFFATQEAARLMIPKRRGKIVNFASTAAFVSSSTPETAYDISKGGVRQLTISVAAELAPHNINVNAVAPGTIMTDLTLRVLNTEEKMARASAKIPLGRLGKPEDMVGPVLFLCSQEAAYVTGHVLVVDGGWLLF